jgi:hypothetical protein
LRIWNIYIEYNFVSGGIMNDLKLSSLTLKVKIYVTGLLTLVGLTYLMLVLHKWLDTGGWPYKVAEGFQYMEYIELTDHVHIFFPYYWLFVFAIPITLFMLTSFSENIKRFFALFPFLVIVVDSACVYLIPYVSTGFAMLLWLTGVILGFTLLALLMFNFYDLWFRKAAVN